MSLTNLSHHTGNRTRDMPACSAFLRPTASPRASVSYSPLVMICLWCDLIAD